MAVEPGPRLPARGRRRALLSVLPLLVLVAMGWMVGRIPAAVEGGFGSSAGDALVRLLVVVGVAFLASMLAAPFHEWLAAAIEIRA